MAMTEIEFEGSAYRGADVMRVSLGDKPKPQDQRSPGCTRCQIVTMPKRQDPAATRPVYRALLLTSGFGSMLGLFALDAHPVLGSMVLIAAVIGLLISSAVLVPVSQTIADPVKEIQHVGRRPR